MGRRGSVGPVIVMVGVSGSAASEHALAFATGLALRQGSEVVAVHVRRPAVVALADQVVDTDALESYCLESYCLDNYCLDNYCEEQRSDIQWAACEILGTCEVTWRYVVRTGDVVDEIHTVAASCQAFYRHRCACHRDRRLSALTRLRPHLRTHAEARGSSGPGRPLTNPRAR